MKPSLRPGPHMHLANGLPSFLVFSRRPADHRRFIFNWGPPPFSLISIRIWPPRKKSRISLLFGTDSPLPTHRASINYQLLRRRRRKRERERRSREREKGIQKAAPKEEERCHRRALAGWLYIQLNAPHTHTRTHREKREKGIGGPPPFGFPRVGVVVRSHLSLSSHCGAPRARRGEETEERNE